MGRVGGKKKAEDCFTNTKRQATNIHNQGVAAARFLMVQSILMDLMQGQTQGYY
jgi:hypothetical protein